MVRSSKLSEERHVFNWRHCVVSWYVFRVEHSLVPRRNRRDGLCPRCVLRAKDYPHRYCLPCHAAYMRDWRKSHGPTDEGRRRAIARAYTKVYVRRGKLHRSPCCICGSSKSQIHHLDYVRPLLIVWVCRSCHEWIHLIEKAQKHRRATALIVRREVSYDV